MHEHDEILSKYMLKCHLGPTQTQTNKMGHSPIKKIKKKNLQGIKFFPTLSKINSTVEFLESKALSKESKVKRY